MDLEVSNGPLYCSKYCLDVHTYRLCSTMSNGDFLLKERDNIDYKDVEVGKQDTDELIQASTSMVSRSLKKLTSEQQDELKELVTEFKDFQSTLWQWSTNTSTSDVYFVGSKITSCESQTPEQLDFLRKEVQEIESAGFIYLNKSKWACALRILPKPSNEGLRFTVDLRSVNSKRLAKAHADIMLARHTRSQVFFNLDFIDGYWKFPLSFVGQLSEISIVPFKI